MTTFPQTPLVNDVSGLRSCSQSDYISVLYSDPDCRMVGTNGIMALLISAAVGGAKHLKN